MDKEAFKPVLKFSERVYVRSPAGLAYLRLRYVDFDRMRATLRECIVVSCCVRDAGKPQIESESTQLREENNGSAENARVLSRCSCKR